MAVAFNPPLSSFNSERDVTGLILPAEGEQLDAVYFSLTRERDDFPGTIPEIFRRVFGAEA